MRCGKDKQDIDKTNNSYVPLDTFCALNWNSLRHTPCHTN